MTDGPTRADLEQRLTTILERSGSPGARPSLLDQVDDADFPAEIRKVLALLGDHGNCRSCGAAGFWLHHRSADGVRRAACLYEPDGRVHFATCPHAKQWSRPTKKKAPSAGRNKNQLAFW